MSYAPLSQFNHLFNQDYANPITWGVMTDFLCQLPDNQMEQVQNALKMLIELPGKIAPLAVKVNDEVYSVNELLRWHNGT